jgi:hypothetical protein
MVVGFYQFLVGGCDMEWKEVLGKIRLAEVKAEGKLRES